MSLHWKLQDRSSQHELTTAWISQFLPLLATLIAAGVEEESPPPPSPLYPSVTLSGPLALRDYYTCPGGDDQEEGGDGTLPPPHSTMTLYTHKRGSGGQTLWESPLTTLNRGEMFVTSHHPSSPERTLTWRVDPLSALAWLGEGGSYIVEEEGGLERVAGEVRATRTRARALACARQRVVGGGEAWTREEKLQLLCSLRMTVSSWGESRVLSEEERSTLASFETGEAELNKVEEEEEEKGEEGEAVSEPPTGEGRDGEEEGGLLKTANGE